MKRFVKKLFELLRGRQPGFTLVELLVVVGIIVALAAVIIPSVAQFAGKGTEGAQSAEMENVQAAMDTMMADQGVTTMTAHDLGIAATSTNTFASEPQGAGTAFLGPTGGGYLREDTTIYFYCWSDTGLIVEQTDTAVLCTQ